MPLAVAASHRWEEQGRIMSRDGAQRLIIVERKIINGVIARVGEKMGREFERTITYAKAFDAWQYVRSLMTGWKKLMISSVRYRKPFYELLCDQARILGMADAVLREYSRGGERVISCTQCYNRHLFAGDILGAYYAVEEKEGEIDVREDGGETVFTVRATGNERCEEIERYTFSWEVPLPGYISYKRCGSCGTPFPVSFLSWDTAAGLMVDTFNGEPVTLIDVAGINAAYLEARSRFGSWVDDFLATEVKEMVDTLLPGLEWKRRRPEERVRDLFFLAYRGMGNPIFTEPTGDGMRARVENPFNYPMVAGITTSFLARGRPVSFEWERSMPGRLEVTLHFL